MGSRPFAFSPGDPNVGAGCHGLIFLLSADSARIAVWISSFRMLGLFYSELLLSLPTNARVAAHGPQNSARASFPVRLDAQVLNPRPKRVAVRLPAGSTALPALF